MREIFLEIGTTRRTLAHTGIQRVVRNVLANLEAAGAESRCVAVHFSGRTFLRHHASDASAPRARLLQRAKLLLGRVVPRAWLRAAKQRAQQVCQALTLPAGSDEDVLAMLARRGMATSPPILLLLDSSWHTEMWPAVARFRRLGGHASAVLYDLIPFTHPETVEAETRRTHTAWWREAPARLDSLLCISHAVRQEFLDWQKTLPGPHLPPERVGVFHLGSELPVAGPSALPLPAAPYFLTVGTLEPRKNHARILDAFEALWREGMEARLVLAGAFGWKSEALLKRLRRHAEWGGRLLHFPKATDADLAALYDQAAGVIAASLAEGFGLPVVEARQRGARVLCSDIPVFREIAGGDALYFDPFDPASIAQAVRRALGTPAPPAAANWISWRQSTEQLFAALGEISA